ncbi:hypothetical protein F5Y15DRAFT_141957 [Xylariaceae sp. FL0016]|nr:hypothetical protein F5Y15DRAFT_141957 [Xylariaceae sp. FL0016]
MALRDLFAHGRTCVGLGLMMLTVLLFVHRPIQLSPLKEHSLRPVFLHRPTPLLAHLKSVCWPTEYPGRRPIRPCRVYYHSPQGYCADYTKCRAATWIRRNMITQCGKNIKTLLRLRRAAASRPVPMDSDKAVLRAPPVCQHRATRLSMFLKLYLEPCDLRTTSSLALTTLGPATACV